MKKIHSAEKVLYTTQDVESDSIIIMINENNFNTVLVVFNQVNRCEGKVEPSYHTIDLRHPHKHVGGRCHFSSLSTLLEHYIGLQYKAYEFSNWEDVLFNKQFIGLK